MKHLLTLESFLNPADKAGYLAWKRKNVSYRGVVDQYSPNNGNGGGGARFGDGLYTAALSNKAMAKKYGTVLFVVNAVPKNPKVFKDANMCEIWLFDTLVRDYFKGQDIDQLDMTYQFQKETSIGEQMLKLGYDGIIISGREMVNFAPDMDEIRYFKDESQVEGYYETYVLGK